MTVEDNKRLMKTLDDAWNSHDWDTFNKRHAEKSRRVLAGSARPGSGVLSYAWPPVPQHASGALCIGPLKYATACS